MRVFLTQVRLIVGLAILALTVAACGSGGTPSPSSDAPESEAPASDPPDSAPSADAAWEPEFVDGVLQPLPDGFPNGPITIAVNAEPGDDDGIYARQFAQAAADISPVAVNVVDRPDLGNQWELLNWVAEQPGGTDGQIFQVATWPGAVFDLLVLPIEEELGLTLDDFDTLMITESVPWVIVSRVDAPWGNNVEDFVQYAKDNPGEVTALVRGPDSGTTMAWQDFAKKMEIETNDVVGGSSSDIVATIGAGEADVALTIVGGALPVIEAGRAVVLTCTGATSPCEGPFDEVPAISELTGELSPWGANRALVINADAPDLHRQWMDTLVRAVVDTDAFQEQRSAVPGYVRTDGGNDEAQEIARAAYAVAYGLLEDQGLLHPSAPESP